MVRRSKNIRWKFNIWSNFTRSSLRLCRKRYSTDIIIRHNRFSGTLICISIIERLQTEKLPINIDLFAIFKCYYINPYLLILFQTTVTTYFLCPDICHACIVGPLADIVAGDRRFWFLPNCFCRLFRYLTFLDFLYIVCCPRP